MDLSADDETLEAELNYIMGLTQPDQQADQQPQTNDTLANVTITVSKGNVETMQPITEQSMTDGIHTVDTYTAKPVVKPIVKHTANGANNNDDNTPNTPNAPEPPQQPMAQSIPHPTNTSKTAHMEIKPLASTAVLQPTSSASATPKLDSIQEVKDEISEITEERDQHTEEPIPA